MLLGTRVVSDLRGRLAILDPLPFKAVRMFQIDRVPHGRDRGNHAHRTCSQLIYCAAGRFAVEYIWSENGSIEFKRRELTAGQWTIANPLTWIKLSYFTQNAVCLVLADEPYSEPITNFDEFAQLIGIPPEQMPHDSILRSSSADSSDPTATGQSDSEGGGQRDLPERPTS